MKRIIFLLLLACSTFTSGYAQQQWRRGRVLVQNPDNVIKVLENIINDCEEHKTTTYSVTKDPNTGVVESSVRVIHFKSWMDYDRMEDIEKAFQKDEPKSYQLVHVIPGNTGNKKFINVPVCSESDIEYIDIRSNLKQETWMMCTKNSTNPKLRDVYAITWKMNTKDKAEGDIFYITSLRPDLYEKKIETSNNTFMIDGRVGYDLNDSLYVVYMADSAEELDQIADSAFIAYMPVVNKRFSFSIELDKPKVGRIRTVMPDGSLCELWTNLDFVPGETYRITTHNGFYDGDNDYEMRVGRYSGKSLLNRDQIKGIDDQKEAEESHIVVPEQKDEFFIVTDNEMVTWYNSLNNKQKARLMELQARITTNGDALKGNSMGNGKLGQEIEKDFANGNKEVMKSAVNIYIRLCDDRNKIIKDYDNFFAETKAPSNNTLNMNQETLKEYSKIQQNLIRAKDTNGNKEEWKRWLDYVNKQVKFYTDKLEKLVAKAKQQ